VSVPELVEENHEGKPRYNSVYTRALSRGTADLLGRDAIVNKEPHTWRATTNSLSR